MDLTIALTILSIVVALIIGIWQIILARKQIQRGDEKEKPITKRSTINEISANTQKRGSFGGQEITNTSQETKPRDMDEGFEYYKRPFPDEIVKEIDKLVLYQQEAAKESYYGLRVQWEVKIQSIHISKSSDTIIDIMALDRGHIPWVTFEIDSNDFPEIKSAKSNDKVLVFGEISNIGIGDITLSKCKLRFFR